MHACIICFLTLHQLLTQTSEVYKGRHGGHFYNVKMVMKEQARHVCRARHRNLVP